MKRSFLLPATAIGLLALFMTAKSFALELNDHSAPAPMPPAGSRPCTAPSGDGQDHAPDPTGDLGIGERLLCFLRLGTCTDPRF